MKQIENLPGNLKRLRELEIEIYNLIPHCDDSQLCRLEEAMNNCLGNIKYLEKTQNDFIDELLEKINEA